MPRWCFARPWRITGQLTRWSQRFASYANCVTPRTRGQTLLAPHGMMHAQFAAPHLKERSFPARIFSFAPSGCCELRFRFLEVPVVLGHR
jgi:hypothetical protein